MRVRQNLHWRHELPAVLRGLSCLWKNHRRWLNQRLSTMDFDEYAERYQSVVETVAKLSIDRLSAEKARLVTEVLRTTLDRSRRPQLLDIGCGIGLIARELE